MKRRVVRNPRSLKAVPDHRIRLASFDWLTQQVEVHGDVLSWALPALGFPHCQAVILFEFDPGRG